jgi:peptide subunit release factor 1 (eRF1)
VTALSTSILNRTRTLKFLEELAADSGSGARTLYLTPGLSDTEIIKAVKSFSIDPVTSDKITELARRSETGAAILHGHMRRCLVLPPFPIKDTAASDSFNTEPLLSLLRTEYRIGLVLVRLGAYAIGVCRGDTLVSSKVGTGLVHGRHKKGGSSAHRFERHRDKQIEYFLTRVCRRAREQLEPHEKSLDYLVYGGARTTVQLLHKQCTFIDKLEKKTLPPLFDIPEPRQVVLEKAVERVWSSTIYEWREEQDT